MYNLKQLKKLGTEALRKKAVKQAEELGFEDLKQFELMDREGLIDFLLMEDDAPEPETPTSRLRAQIEEAQIAYKNVEMPINVIASEEFEGENGMILSFANNIKLRAGRVGLQYLAYRLHNDGKVLAKFLKGDADGVEVVKSFNASFEAIHPKKRGKMIAAIFKGELVGMMKNYQAVSHNEIVDAIERYGLAESIAYSHVDQYCMNMILDVNAKGDYIAGLRIVNGHSGHVSFRYSSAFKAGDFEFDIPMVARVRHLSSVIASVESLKSLIEGAAELRIDELLRKTSVRRVSEIIRDTFIKPNKRQQILLDNAEIGKDCENALDYILKLSDYTHVQGYKKAASSIMNRIIDAIVNPTKTI